MSETACGFALVPATFGFTVAEAFCTDWIADAGAAHTANAATVTAKIMILRIEWFPS